MSEPANIVSLSSTFPGPNKPFEVSVGFSAMKTLKFVFDLRGDKLSDEPHPATILQDIELYTGQFSEDDLHE